MRYRQLGSSDLHVSAVSLGTWKTYGGGRVPPEPQLGITVSQPALAWVLREENVASAIVGASRPEQVRENAAAVEVDLDPATIAELGRIFG